MTWKTEDKMDDSFHLLHIPAHLPIILKEKKDVMIRIHIPASSLSVNAIFL
jgi:hypothetical protein